ncbi:M13-type metalloendopeptidase [Methanocorpusculum vombati]|uniref:M13 family metallopeptidase n=1 Tax=Methanocorpusculum vombati TaxID=3002864 RepID=A0ABT4INS8_9EURY|nr:M13 family metallopeptidase [Methanocorpusculum vombati]MCZ9320388.1 M13 family metallopeptidase [Methanocorpusculum sp.]MCZ0863413.1 M13 family metallopeptidase [Methanocorpusculum vombati]MDE2520068.1 M13 family metallopeptidase [Methanocorpusculum sp.]MDE2534211.1 M13 family metallopeptidase [Methanocorpusculum sp.]MDE2545865.1 M13 family metallopeptidase [Methanocorpusculum sp.]
MKIGKRIGAALLVVVVLIAAAGCVATPQNETIVSPTGENAGSGWIVSDLAGSVTADMNISVQDDFHAAVNKEWLSSSKIPADKMMISTFTERNDEVTQEILALMDDTTQTSHEAKLVQQLYHDFIDMDTRNALGMTPIMPFVEDIQKIKTIDDLTAYLTDDKGKIAGAPMGVSIMADFKDSTHNAVYIGAPSLSLGNMDDYRNITPSGERQKAANAVSFQKLLIRAGYTKEEAANINEVLFALESKIASACDGLSASSVPGYQESIYNPVSTRELKELSPTFPVTDFLQPYISAGVDRFILTEPDWLEKMNELYTEENVEGFKAILLRNTLMAGAAVLDQECLDILTESSSAIAGSEIHPDLNQTAYETTSSLLDMAVGKMYADAYVQPKTKQDVEELITKVVAVYRERLQNTSWLGEDTRKKAIEKLDALKVRVAYPDDWSLYDYTGLTLKSKEEGGNLLTNVMAIKEMNREQNVQKALTPIDSNMWITTQAAPQTVNAFYYFLDNSINIPAGILGGDFYDPEASEEKMMGTIGMIIGHEITHGFDTGGSQFDKDGNLKNWWTSEDKAAFANRTAKVAEYFGQFEVLPGVFVNGQLTIGETVADLGGLSCMLEIAGTMEDFDYTTFFTSYATLWKEQASQNILELQTRTDAHPPGYLRTNAIVQQVQEFYDTFNVTEGDGMYLAPEDRLSVW